MMKVCWGKWGDMIFLKNVFFVENDSDVCGLAMFKYKYQNKNIIRKLIFRIKKKCCGRNLFF